MKITKMLLIMSLLVTTPAGAVASTTKEILLTSFDTQSADLAWRVVNDGVMGGRSSSDFNLADGVLTFSGVTNTNGGGFASIRSGLMDFSLAGFTHFALRVRTDGRSYTLLLRPKNQRISYRMDFLTQPGQWQEVVLPIEQFQASWRGRKLNEPPIDPANIEQVGIMISDGRDGEFKFEIDWLQARSEMQ
jgi:NADH dehydrogenase [ubiquinone] 1 alpha subcomplex assembly factor 1